MRTVSSSPPRLASGRNYCCGTADSAGEQRGLGGGPGIEHKKYDYILVSEQRLGTQHEGTFGGQICTEAEG